MMDTHLQVLEYIPLKDHIDKLDNVVVIQVIHLSMIYYNTMKDGALELD